MSRFAIVLLIAAFSGLGIAQGPVASHAPTVPATATAAASASAALPPSAVVARVNGAALTQADLDEAKQAIFPFFRQHNGKIPDSAAADIQKEAMDKIVLNELQYQEARRRNMKVPEAQLQKGLAELRKSFKSPQIYKAAIIKKYGSEAAFEKRIRRNLLVKQLWDTEVTRKSAVTAAEVQAYYRQNITSFARPEAVSLQSISVMLPKDATEEQKKEARKRAEELLPKARAAKNYEAFGMLAEQVSEDDWHVMMGDHKLVHRGEVDPPFEVIFTMKAGETSGVIESAVGFHILRVNEYQPKRQMTFAEVRDRLRKDLQAKRREERVEAFEKGLRKNAKIVM